MDFTSYTVELLKLLNNITGSYGFAIIALTIIVRACLWPLGVSQQRSMRAMQVLQPKMKLIQERYKNDPQMAQRKLMEFYKENNCNPMAGWLPLLIQMPIFILLYTALISPQFIQEAGNSNFFFINRLDKTLRGSAGTSYDGTFSISDSNDKFVVYKNVKVFLGDEELDNVKIDSKNAIKVQGDIEPGQSIDLKINLDDFNLKYSQLEKMTSAVVDIQNMKTREVETVKFERKDGIMAASMPTDKPQNQFNFDVFILILLFAVTMFATQKVVMAQNKNTQQDPMQAQMQKMMGTMMPVMIIFMFVIAPIPAGVLLYLVVSNIIQIIQTIVINKQLENEENLKHNVKDLSEVKTIKPIETKTIETDKK
ncbi:MAG: YidC/Oxa1 family membrane protein insertase [Candidatus Gastranaerophilales bacterium]|nr:YidC/Oxa1 family membrane protein insertase [Candidatus Gastranaerophilales bacterium]